MIQPSAAGNGLAVKTVCEGITNAGGYCTVPGGSLNSVARAVAALNQPVPSAAPDVATVVLSWVPALPVNWSDFQQPSIGLFANDNDFRGLYGNESYQTPFSFAGYLAIPASATPVTKSFAVGSDDGFLLALSNGSQIFKYTVDAPRSYAVGGTPSAVSGTQPPATQILTVTFPAAATGMLYPIELIFYEQVGQEGVELMWADGAKSTVPAAGALNGFALVPVANLYAPDVRAIMTVQNTDSATGLVGAGTHLTYTAQIVNRGTVAASNLSFTVMLPSTITYPTQNNAACTAGATSGGVTPLVCANINLAAGASQTITFNAVVSMGTTDAGTTNIDLQGVVQGLATSTDFTSVIGDTSSIYVTTDDPAAGPPLSTTDTGNAPTSLTGNPGLTDDDPTRVVIGAELTQPPVITAPAAPVPATSRVTISGTSSYSSGQLILVTISGPVSKTCTATVGANGTWACASTMLPDGSYTAVAAAESPSGQTAPGSAPFPITITAPAQPVLTSPANGAVLRNTQVFLAGTENAAAGTTVTVTVTDSSNAIHICTATVQSDQTWVCAETLPDGGYSWTAAVPELAGGFGPAAAVQVFTVNTAGLPAPTIAQTASPTKVNEPQLSGTAMVSDSGAAYKLVVYDGNTPVCTISPVPTSWTCTPTTPLADGSHVLTASIFDGGGNASPASNPDAFVIDTTAPAAPTLAQVTTPTNRTKPVLSGTGEPGATVTVTDSNNAVLCTAAVLTDGDWSCTPTTALSQGSHTATAKQTDSAGNTSRNSAPMTFVIDTTSPGTPTIAQPTSPTSVNTPTLTGTADAGTTIVVTDQAGTVLCTVSPVASNGKWSCQSGALPDGSDTLTATSSDAAGNMSTSSPVTVVVDTIAPPTPVLAQTTSPGANTKPTFSGTAQAGTTVSVTVNGTVVCTAVATAGKFSCTSTVTLPGAPTTYTATATSKDAAGNISAPSNGDVFVVDTTTPAAPTLNPLPTPPGGQPNTTDQSQPTFTGTGTPGDLASVETEPGGAILCSAVVAADGTWQCTTQANMAINGDPATQVTVQAVQENPAGAVSAPSAPMTFTVSTGAPTTPTMNPLPAITSNAMLPLSGSADAGTTVTVRDETGRVICVVAVVPASGLWACTPTTPLHDGVNTLSAVSVGPSGIASPPSNTVTTTVDTIAPQAPTIAQTPSPTANTLPTFTGTAEPGSTVKLYEGGTTPIATCIAAADGTYSCPATTPLTGAPSTHSVQATSIDAAGNVSPLSNVDTFVVDTTQPAAPTLNPIATPAGAAPGNTDVTQPVFTGTGTPGDTVTVQSTAPTMQPLCTATVLADGAWSCTSSVPLTGDPATTYTFTATQTSPAGTVSAPSAPITETISTAQPMAPTLVVPPAPSASQNVPLHGTGTPGDTVVALDPTGQVLCTALVQPDGTWSCTTIALPEGPTTVVAVDVSTSGVASPPSPPGVVVVLSYGPVAPQLAQTPSPSTNMTPGFTGKAEAGTTVTVSEGGMVLCTAVADMSGSFSCTEATPLANGQHDVTATSTDGAGNVSAPSNIDAFTIGEPTSGTPVVAITSPTTGAQIVNTRPQISGTSTPGTTVTVTIDGTSSFAQAAPDGTWTLTPPGDLSQGMHTVVAVATTSSGTASAPSSITIQIYENLEARGGCASGGVPMPVLALLAACLILRLRRKPTVQRTAEAASAAPRSLLRRVSSVGVAAVVALFATEARAQANFDVETFHPAAGGDGYVGVEGARPPDDDDAFGKLDVKLWLDGTNKPLVVIETDGSKHALVRQRYDGWLSAQFHLNGPLSLSAQIPVLFAQNGDLSFLPPAARGPSSFAASIGDVRITPRVSIFRQENVGVDFSAQGSLELPTGETDSLSSDGRVNGELLVAMAHRIYLAGPDSIEVIGNVYTRLRPPREILDVKVGSTVGLRGGVGYYFGSEKSYVPERVFGELDGQSYLRAGFTSGSAPAEWRVGATYCFKYGVSVDAAIGTGIGNGVGAPTARGLLGIGYSPSSCREADRDGDGIPDREDKCVNTPGDRAHAGCPPPAIADRDHDGVPDAEDACPDEPGLQENHGCPASHDRDGDGVPDLTDRCPDVPGPASNQGCPAPAAPVVCAPPPEPPKTEIALPLPPPPPADRDHDGVPDDVDNCPDEAGTGENHGCPAGVKQLVVIHGNKLDILEKIYFATGKSDIEERSFGLLDQVARVLVAHPELLRVEVQGHTDNVGDPKRNEKLSQVRAEAVESYLVKKKVAIERLSAKGYGSTQPVAPNTSKLAREKNRRVEFHVLDVGSHTIDAVKSSDPGKPPSTP